MTRQKREKERYLTILVEVTGATVLQVFNEFKN